MALSVREIETTRHDPKKIIWLKDGKGLWLCIFKNGTMAWRARYQWNKKTAMLSLGIYPKVSLKDAREQNAAIRDLLDKGINPAKERLVVKKEVQNTTTFRHFADEWQTKQIHWSEKTRRINKQRIENFLYPVLADIEIRELKEDDFIRAIQPLLDREVYELLGWVKRLFNSIYEYVREVYYHDLHNPAAYIGKRFPKPIKKHYPTITNRAEVGELLFAIEQNQYRATPIVYCAVQLAPLVLLRPSEIVEANWDEINFRREVLNGVQK